MDERYELTVLNAEGLQSLRDIVKQLREHNSFWGEVRGGERNESGSIQMPWTEPSAITSDAMRWQYEHGRSVPFKWASWDEGREIFRDWKGEATTASLDHLTTCKLLTAVARNNRFSDGAWVGMFEKGHGVALFERLLEHEEELAGR